MELSSGRFPKAVLATLDAEQTLATTVMAEAHPVVEALKTLPEENLLEVTVGHRDELAGKATRAMTSKE